MKQIRDISNRQNETDNEGWNDLPCNLFFVRGNLIWMTFVPNTHRRRQRDSTVELSRVVVASASAVCIEFATSSRRLPTSADENLETEHVENLSCPVEPSWVVSAVCTHPSTVVTQFTILQPICDWCRKLETGSWLTTGAFTPPTPRNSTSLSANCSDSSRLVETVANYMCSCEFNTHRWRNSTRQLSCVGVGGVYWALGRRKYTWSLTSPCQPLCHIHRTPSSQQPVATAFSGIYFCNLRVDDINTIHSSVVSWRRSVSRTEWWTMGIIWLRQYV